MKYKIGFIGAGNMAKAIIKGLLSASIVKEDEILASASSQNSIDQTKASLKIQTTLDNTQVARECEYVILAIKPYMVETILQEISDYLSPDQVVISIAAGITLDQLAEWTDHKVRLYRAMPNTPAHVNAGMTSLCTKISSEDPSYSYVISLFEAIGKCEVIKESLIHAAIAIHGSSPAYVYMMLEAMGDAGVLLGLPRDQAYKMAAQSLYGAALMSLETGLHPGVLKDQVTSPGGTTIEAVASLEKSGFRSDLIEAMVSCASKSIQMSTKK
ncbi:pyrroline-5-carboxylate reductase [Fusibacter ferrireducens]|uniref:Pyrroline-5-carboxylate reductase n=1 Tax=Fusibacter ferrireducens TaxID=2785058 RepID=A0ABR9ZT00_9FIRM|nr:pyrroline-5-carboxylate reductase [Fusibacter ferrireducens]MBF4693578.1 pyrroline-5-carboxylate reductase [Fusibacter ferrireducens]